MPALRTLVDRQARCKLLHAKVQGDVLSCNAEATYHIWLENLLLRGDELNQNQWWKDFDDCIAALNPKLLMRGTTKWPWASWYMHYATSETPATGIGAGARI